MNVQELYKKDIEEIWQRQIDEHPETAAEDIIARGYAVERELPHRDVLFIGMNPAFNGNHEELWRNYFYPPCQGNSFFNAIAKFSESTLGYKNASHHDLLFIRHTSQKYVQSLFKNEHFKDFMERQLALSVKIIKQLNPKLIVVLNAGAGELLVKDKQLPFDKELGAYIAYESTPVLFSSMLSGVRPLDKGSRKSLEWHINYILDKLK